MITARSLLEVGYIDIDIYIYIYISISICRYRYIKYNEMSSRNGTGIALLCCETGLDAAAAGGPGGPGSEPPLHVQCVGFPYQ